MGSVIVVFHLLKDADTESLSS